MRSYRGWTRLFMLAVLLSLAWSCVSLPVAKPVPGPFFVTPEITYLRDSPGYEGKVLTPLYKGDKVARLDAGEAGSRDGSEGNCSALTRLPPFFTM